MREGVITGMMVLIMAFFLVGLSVAEESLELEFQNWTLHGKGENIPIGSGNAELSLNVASNSYGYWLSSPLELWTNSVYRLAFQALAAQNGGSPEVGLTSYNKSLGWWAERRWSDYTIVFAASDKIIPERSSLRFGQYGMRGGEIRYRNIHLSRVKPEYAEFNSLELGAGEILYDNRYQFITRFIIHGNHSRPLKSFQCAYNSNRWVFFKDDYVIYEHNLAGLKQVTGHVELHIDWHRTGKLIVEVALCHTENKWIKIGEVAKAGEVSLAIPPDLYPAESIKIRLRSESNHSFKGDFDPGTIQVGAYRYFAELDRTFKEILKGTTTYRRR